MLKKLCLKNDDATHCLRNKSGKAKLWKSICLVMKKTFQPDLTSFDPSKKLSAKIALKLYFRKN